jgi:hypothetical protein
MVDSKDYPYMATWCSSPKEADEHDAFNHIKIGWVHWNGIFDFTPPKFVRYQGKTYTFEEFKKEVWKL